MGPSLELLRGAGLVDIRIASLYHEVHGTGAHQSALPGGHAGFVTDPEAFVQLVTRIAKPPNRC
jgi:hypothetical protein